MVEEVLLFVFLFLLCAVLETELFCFERTCLYACMFSLSAVGFVKIKMQLGTSACGAAAVKGTGGGVLSDVWSCLQHASHSLLRKPVQSSSESEVFVT